MPYICDKFHFGWPEGVVFGKRQMSFEHATFAVNRTIRDTDLSQTPHPSHLSLGKVLVKHLLQCVWRPDDHHFPSVEIVIPDQAC